MYYYPIIGLDAGNYNFYVTSAQRGMTKLNQKCVPTNGKAVDIKVSYFASSDKIAVNSLNEQDIAKLTASDALSPPSDGAAENSALNGTVLPDKNLFASVIPAAFSAICVFVFLATGKSKRKK